METLVKALTEAIACIAAAQNEERVTEVRRMLMQSDTAPEKVIFIAAHHEYYESRAEDDERYGKLAFQNYIESGHLDLAHYMKVVRKRPVSA